MRGGFRLGVVVCGVVAAAACGHPRAPVSPVRVPVKAATVRAAPPRRALPEPVQWLKAEASGDSSDALRIGDRILWVSEDGDRVLMPPDDPVYVPDQRSRFALPGAISVVHSGDSYGFAEKSGAIYVTRTPLGPPISRRASPAPHKLFASAGGRQAIVALTREGTVIRTTDLGRTWTTTAENAVGVPEKIAMNHQGQGLLLTQPQAVWATLDDGATWKHVASTDHGVENVQLGNKGSLWTVPIGPDTSVDMFASLFDNGVLRDAPDYRTIQAPTLSYTQYLAADRVVLITQPLYGRVQAALEPLDGALSPHWQNLPGVESCDHLRAAAYGKTSYVGCWDDPHFVVWSNRGSGPWKCELDFDASRASGFPLIAGPGGWLLAADHIRPKTGAPPVRVEGADRDDWQSVVAGGVVHLLGEEPGDEDELKLYYARATPDKPIIKIKPIKLGVDVEWASLFVDGTKAKVLAGSQSHVVAIDPRAGKDAPTAPFNALDRTYLVLMHDKRGIALVRPASDTGDCWLAETADGGADWTKIPVANGGVDWSEGSNGQCGPKQGPNHCTDSGCQLGQDIRVGWSLGGALPAPTPVAPERVPPVRKLGAPIGLVCTLHGPARKIGDGKESELRSSFTVGGDLRWATPAYGKTIRVVGAFRDGKRFDKLLLGRAPRGRNTSHTSLVTPDALVVARESQAKRSKRVSAEIAAFDFEKRRVVRGSVANAGRFKRFHITELGYSGGQAWYRAGGAGPVFVLEKTGRVTRRKAPSVWFPPGSTEYDDDKLVALDGAPATFSRFGSDVAFGAGDRYAHWYFGDDPRPGSWNGKPALGGDVPLEPGKVTEGFAVLLGTTPDPEIVGHVTRTQLGNGFDHACKPGARGGVVTKLENAATVVLDGPGKPASKPLPAYALVRLRPARPPCVIGWVTQRYVQADYDPDYVPADDPAHASAFRWRDGVLESTDLSCRAAASPAKSPASKTP